MRDDVRKALDLLADRFPYAIAPETAQKIAMKVAFAAELRETATPVDAHNADRLDDIERLEKQLPEWNRVFGAKYPDVIADMHSMVEEERARANAARVLKARLGPKDYLFVKALKAPYREATGKHPSRPATDRISQKITPNGFTDFVLAAFAALCEGEPPSLNTISHALRNSRKRAKAANI
jgi:hypothetical protein